MAFSKVTFLSVCVFFMICSLERVVVSEFISLAHRCVEMFSGSRCGTVMVIMSDVYGYVPLGLVTFTHLSFASFPFP